MNRLTAAATGSYLPTLQELGATNSQMQLLHTSQRRSCQLAVEIASTHLKRGHPSIQTAPVGGIINRPSANQGFFQKAEWSIHPVDQLERKQAMGWFQSAFPLNFHLISLYQSFCPHGFFHAGPITLSIAFLGHQGDGLFLFLTMKCWLDSTQYFLC